MRTLTILIMTIALLGQSANMLRAEETYITDQDHTEVHFQWNHAGMSFQSGEFLKAEGVLSLDRDSVEASNLTVQIEAASLHTGVKILDRLLKSPVYFQPAKYPALTFKSTSILRTGDKTAKVTGDLTIRDVTLPITLDVEMTFDGPHPRRMTVPIFSGDWLAFKGTAEIDPADFGVGPSSTGKVTIAFTTEMRKQ